MKQLGDLIVSKTLKNQTKEVYRRASRGIIIKGDKVLMIHCAYFNDYTFPGGGVEKEEEYEVGLVRECMEEAGVIIENIRPFYMTMEKRELDDESYILHESHFFICDIKEYTTQHLETYEVELGYNPVWISVSDAIKNNIERMNALKETDYKGVLEREIRILKMLEEEIL